MPTTSVNFSTKCLSLLSLKVSIRCGCSFSAFQTRCTAILEIPRCFAKLRVVQCVRPSGFTCTVDHAQFGPMRPALWLHLHSGMDEALPHLGGYHPLAAALATSIAQPLGGAFGNRLLCSSWLSHRRLRSRRRIPLGCGFGSLVPGFRFGHAPPPQGRGLAINVQLPADLAVAMPLTGQQDNPSPLRQLLGGVSSPRQRLQSSTHCVVDEYCQCHGLSEHTSRKMSSFDCGFTLAPAPPHSYDITSFISGTLRLLRSGRGGRLGRNFSKTYAFRLLPWRRASVMIWRCTSGGTRTRKFPEN